MKPREEHAINDRRAGDCRRQRAFERQQIAGEIAAVDGRDVRRRERDQANRVVPVVEVSSISRQLQKRRERRFEAADHFGEAEVSKIAGGQRGDQLQADVGRRRTVRDQLFAIFLDVVGDEPVIARPDEVFEE